MNEAKRIAELIASQSESLITSHWPDIEEYRDEDEEMKVSFSHQITYAGQKRIVKSTISFNKRMKDTLADEFDTTQRNFDFVEPAKRRGRPPTKTSNISISVPPPATQEIA
jgi:hypothetical protein